MVNVIKDLTPKLREIEAEDLADPRPWYEKDWPYMRHEQRIKIISACGGMLEGKETLAERIMAKLIAFLAPRVNYDLKQKLFVVEEVLAQHEPYEYVGDKGAYAKLTLFKDYRGKVIPTEHQDDRVKNGDYLLALIELYTGNWCRFSINWLEHNLAHELLHVVDPQLGMYVKNGRLWENERTMKKATIDVLRAMKHKNNNNAQRD